MVRLKLSASAFQPRNDAFVAVILINPVVRQYVINYGRPFIFTTSMPRTSVCVLNASFDHIGSPAGDEVSIVVPRTTLLYRLITSRQGRERLRRVAEYFCRLLSEALKHISPSLLSLRARTTPSSFPSDIVSPIFPILTEHPTPLAAYLRQFKYACISVPYPAVPRGEERIRIVVHAANQPEELRALVDHMMQWATSMQVQTIQPLMQATRAKL